MNIFNKFFSKVDPNEELKSVIKSQEILDERFRKKQIDNETYKKKSLEFMEKKEKLEIKIQKLNK